jgi:hypothetical protein
MSSEVRSYKPLTALTVEILHRKYWRVLLSYWIHREPLLYFGKAPHGHGFCGISLYAWY